MRSFEAVMCFAEQLERAVSDETMSVKVVRTPTPVREDGMIVKVSVLKTLLDKRSMGKAGARMLRLRVSVCGRVESDQGMKDALTAIERLDEFFEGCNRLEDRRGKVIPDSRITAGVSQEDSFFDGPDSLSVQELQDDRTVMLYIPIE